MELFKGQSLLEFTERFKTDLDCEEYLASIKKADIQNISRVKVIGEPHGMKTADGKVGFRIEFDEKVGAHINVFDKKEKDTPHFIFKASEKTVKKYKNVIGNK